MGYGTTDRISPRVYPWWLILVGFIFGVIVTLIVTASSHSQSTVIYQPVDEQQIWLQATQLVREATAQADAFDSSRYRSDTDLDPLLQQATLMVVEATQAAVNAQVEFGVDPILQTATAIVSQATQQAPR